MEKNKGIYNFMGRSLNIGEQLLSDFEKYIYMPLDDLTVNYYFKLELDINFRKNPELLSSYTDAQLTQIVTSWMADEINVRTEK